MLLQLHFLAKVGLERDIFEDFILSCVTRLTFFENVVNKVASGFLIQAAVGLVCERLKQLRSSSEGLLRVMQFFEEINHVKPRRGVRLFEV